MNKSALKKSFNSHVRLRPMAKRFYGANGFQLPPVDDDWWMGEDSDGVRITNTATGHVAVLGFDQVHHYSTDAARGKGHGVLTLNAQLHIGGNALWTEPTRPGEAIPDQFGHVRGWKRENDPSYIQSLFPPARPTPVPAVNSGNPALNLVLLGLCIGVGLLVANA
jgi:hypothetical protein